MKLYGYFYGNAGRRKMLMLFDDAFTRSLYAAADKANGFRVRKFDRKPIAHGYQGA